MLTIVAGEQGEHVHWGPDVPGARGDVTARDFDAALRDAGEACASPLAAKLRSSAGVPDGAHVVLIQVGADKTNVT